MPSDSGPTSPIQLTTSGKVIECNITSERKMSNGTTGITTNGTGTGGNGGLARSISYDPTEYVTRTRAARAAPPKPPPNTMQFIKIKPCNLYQSAQEQLKRAEEVKKVKEIKKEEPEDWQNNLDNWKSSRRKRVEHIIDRVVEVKKLEMEEHDRQRRKSKTFSEMLEERGSARTKLVLAVYTEDDSNDLSDLGIGTSSASGKSSLSEDFDNHSVISDNQDTEKSQSDVDNNSNHENNEIGRDYVSSPGYDTSSSTAPASSPDPCEYTYESAIQDYKSRISRAQHTVQNGASGGFTNGNYSSKDSTPERNAYDLGRTNEQNFHVPRRSSASKIEDRLLNFEMKGAGTDSTESSVATKKDVPKVNILKRRELFEKERSSSTENLANNSSSSNSNSNANRMSGDFSNAKSIRERLSSLVEKRTDETVGVKDATVKKLNRLSGDMTTIKDRLTNLEKTTSAPVTNEKITKIDVPVVALKDRLTSLQSAVTSVTVKDEIKKPIVLVPQPQKPQHEQYKNDLPTAANIKNVDKQLITDKFEKIKTFEEILIGDDDDAADLHSNDKMVPAGLDNNIINKKQEITINNVNDYVITSNNIQQQPIIPEFKEEKPNVIITAKIPEVIEEPIRKIEEILIEKEIEQQIDITTTSVIPDVVLCNDVPVAADVITNLIEVNQHDEICSPEPTETDTSVIEALDIAFDAIDNEHDNRETQKQSSKISLTTQTIKTKTNCIVHPFNNVKNSVTTLDTEKPLVMARDPIYQNINEAVIEAEKTVESAYQVETIEEIIMQEKLKQVEEEPYYQVPKSSEPYYEVPKSKPVPLYENVDMFYSGTKVSNHEIPFVMNNPMEPPKEKPPPPPVHDASTDEEEDDECDDEEIEETTQEMKRMNSTRRIKKEIRNKRTSFLGLETSADDDSYLELSVAPPPNMAKLLQEERRLDKQFYIKAGLYESSDTSESRDSGVSENHSRQSSEPFNTSSEEQEDYIAKKEKEIIDVLEKEEKRRSIGDLLRSDNQMQTTATSNGPVDEETRIRCIEDQIREQEEVLRVERELLQLEQEELKRQRENLMQRESQARRDLDHGAKMLMSANHRSLQDINATGHYANVPNTYQIYQVHTDYRQSMPDLQNMPMHDQTGRRIPPTPPAKPQRLQLQTEYSTFRETTIRGSRTPSADSNLDIIHTRNHSAPISIAPKPSIGQQSNDEFVQLRNHHNIKPQQHHQQHYNNMSRHTLHALSAVPKPKFTDGWVQQSRHSENGYHDQHQQQIFNQNGNYINKQNLVAKDRTGDSWLALQQKRKSDPHNYNNRHWLIQEAEQRRIEQQRGLRNSASATTNGWANIQRRGSNDNKPLPDSIIQTLTQRVQSRGIGERRRFDNNSTQIIAPIPLTQQQQTTNGNKNVSAIIALTSSQPIITTATTTASTTAVVTAATTQNGHSESAIPQNLLALDTLTQDKILSVSGKKKCSHCGDELGRGAAMIIESLRLFYHIDCFKCCVCHVQLGDGLIGTDVRVRNHKLHCHNCYSSDDGIKFSCV